MNIILNGKQMSFDEGLLPIDMAKATDSELYKAALAARINGKLSSLYAPVKDGDSVDILTFADDDGKKVLRHTASHVMAQAVKRLFPQVKLAIGPAIENGFYYDFDSDRTFSTEDFEAIEKEMAKISKENLHIERFELPRDEAIALMTEKNEPYKVELINDLPEGEAISFYKQGEFTDLCAGPHLGSTGRVKHFKLTGVAGAYWRGNEKNKMLQRIYATAFPSKEELKEYLEMVEEAKKRDHNKIGRELEYFTTVDIIGQGLPILLPKGARVIQLLQRFVEDEEQRRGYLLTKTPLMAKSDLYKLSGHWDHEKEGMFVMGDEEKDSEVFALRPMTCPFQYQVFLNRMRSYRDLPMRLGETSTLFRNEDSGEMHGLIRVRQFTISEGHIICAPDQLEQEFKECLELARYMMECVGFSDDVTYRFSQWDPNDRDKYIGTEEQWNEAQGTMEKILNHLGVKYTIGVGEAAFYGPKLDIQMKNVHGKEDTLITIQIDQMLAQIYGMEFVDKDGQKKTPYILHRTSMGCYERTLALMLEKYAGALPTWIAPTQVIVLPITDRTLDVAKEIQGVLTAEGIRTEIDTRSEKIGYKIRQAQLEKIPYMLVVGDKEAEEGLVAVRSRSEGDIGTMSLEAFLEKINAEIESKRCN